MKNFYLTSYFFILAQIFTTSIIAQEKKGNANSQPQVNIEFWVRQPSKANDPKEYKGNLQSINLNGLTFDELKTFDVQYDKEIKYRGLHLRDLLSIYKPIPDSVDMLLLHGHNGTIIPVTISELRQDREVFIALEVFIDGKWTKEFPKSERHDVLFKDAKPIQFSGNKVVAGTNWRKSTIGITPWRYIDSLVGVEITEGSAYFNQFRVSKHKGTNMGLASYTSRCQYCHNIKGVGAAFGPDMTQFAFLKNKDGWKVVFDKVTATKTLNYQMSHSMPNQTGFTKNDAKQLVRWLNDVNEYGLEAFAPSYAKK